MIIKKGITHYCHSDPKFQFVVKIYGIISKYKQK